MLQKKYLVCQKHNLKITNICVSKHECLDRRLCPNCMKPSENQHPITLLVQEFSEQLTQQMNKLELDKKLIILQKHKVYQEKINYLFQVLQTQVQEVLEYFEKSSDNIKELKNRLKTHSVLELTVFELNQLITILQNNLVEKLNKQIKNNISVFLNQDTTFRNCLEKILSNIELYCQQTSVDYLQDEVKLEGPQKFGIRLGDFYYHFPDGTKQYVQLTFIKAGKIEFNEKQGNWRDFRGKLYNYQKKRKEINMVECEYHVGKSQNNQLQQGNQGDCIENFGQQNQIKFKGKYENDNRIGNWIILVDGKICGGGGYNLNGQKSGLWKELDGKYDEFDCEVIYSGQYSNGVKIGFWTSSIKNNIIGWGEYDLQEMKQGIWKDLHEKFWDDCQVIYQGEYRNGIKVGLWETLNQNKRIGGGKFDDSGIKQGMWNDLHENFDNTCQVTFQGEYRDGVKIGQWTALDKTILIGGGKFDEKGFKQGKWTDMHENSIYQLQSECQVTYQGDYKDGLRIGQWASIFKNKYIGGGIYKTGNKQGKWTDLHENFYQYNQVTYSGEYRYGVKYDRWTTLYKNTLIGGGYYNEKGVKNGQWVDLLENFDDDCKVTYSGLYQDGLRIGQWTTLYQNNEIGGGKYDDQGIKQSFWNDLHKDFCDICQVIISGEYKNGIRIGRWEALYQNNQIGGGMYDNNGIQQGIWTDLHQKFDDNNQVTYSGMYQDGIRIGQWTTFYKNNLIGGGLYDETGVRQSYWTDLDQNYFVLFEVTFKGEYSYGLRIGQWTILYKNNVIGGGEYDKNGAKQGSWIDLDENIYDDSQIIMYLGEYRDGLRIGQWTSLHLQTSEQKLFARYDQKGIKEEI